MGKIITIYQFYEIQYRCEGYIFWRQTDPSRNDSDIEIKQVIPNRNIKQMLSNVKCKDGEAGIIGEVD